MNAVALAGEAEGADAASRPAIAGFVEARTRDRILGWAWDGADPSARQAVVLLAGDRVVARAVADQPREDLARNGIGDGSHAFAFTLDEASQAQAARLDVAVEAADGTRVRLPSAASPGTEPAAILQLQRGLAALAVGQRALMRAVQSPAAAVPDHGGALSGISAQQERIERAVHALEIMVTRLDERLAAAEGAAAPRAPGRPLLLASLLGAAGAAALAWALAPILG
jgi:hypothetical protein